MMERIPDGDSASRRELVGRVLFYESGLHNCYGVANSRDEIVYLQWLIHPSDNKTLQRQYPRKFYPLSNNQVMVENAFTLPTHRGLGLMSTVSLQLLHIACDEGLKSAICYIRKDRISPLNEFIQMGFKITKIATEYRILGKTWRKL